MVTSRLLSAIACVLLTVAAGQSCAQQSASPSPSVSPTPDSDNPPVTPANPSDWTNIGRSVQDRPIRMLTLGQGPRTVLFIGGIHGDEAEGARTTAELPAAFTAAGLGEAVSLYVVEDANPDGRALATRENVNGIDLNRNFPATNFDPVSPSGGRVSANQPETRAMVEIINRTSPALVMVMHSWSNDEFINFDGPASAIAARFSAASGLPVKNSGEFAPTPGSLGSYAGRDRGIPVLTIELLKGSDPQRDWWKIRDAVLGAIKGD